MEILNKYYIQGKVSISNVSHISVQICVNFLIFYLWEKLEFYNKRGGILKCSKYIKKYFPPFEAVNHIHFSFFHKILQDGLVSYSPVHPALGQYVRQESGRGDKKVIFKIE